MLAIDAVFGLLLLLIAIFGFRTTPSAPPGPQPSSADRVAGPQAAPPAAPAAPASADVVAGADPGRSWALRGRYAPLVRLRRMSKPVTQMRNANRNTKPTM